MRRPCLTHSALLELIELAYAAAEDVRLWHTFVASTVDAVAATAGTLMSHNLAIVAGVLTQRRMEPDAPAECAERYHSADGWVTAAGARRRAIPARVPLGDELIERGALKRTDYFIYIQRYGVSRLIHATLEIGAEGVSGLSLFRAERDADFGEAERRFISALTPHVRRALRMTEALAQATIDQHAALDGLDALRRGVLLTTGDARVVYANGAANEILASHDGLSVDADRLVTATPAATSSLHSLCAGCARTTDVLPSAGGALSLTRPSGRRRLQLVVCPLNRRGLRSGCKERVGVLIFVSDPDHDDPLPNRRLLQLFYDLTPAEAEVAARLATGQSLEEIAAARHYTKETARWYSKQILSKTGTQTRAELVRQLSKTLAFLINEDAQHDEVRSGSSSWPRG